MTNNILDIIQKQKTFFKKGYTIKTTFRIQALMKLKKYILAHEKEINHALRQDLGKTVFESYMTETGLVLSEITYMINHIEKFSKEKTVLTPLSQFPSRSFIKPSPYGTVLIISPWNYPFLLAIEPLVDAIAAGNTAVIKVSEFAPKTGAIIKKLINQCFDSKFVSVITGGADVSENSLKADFDYIFFTGSPNIGKIVMKHASEHLTPVTLELGGKSPCIVDSTANIPLAAKRIVFGKFLNCGQTCVAPDYIYCDPAIKDKLILYIKKEIQKQYSKTPLSNPKYGKIINKKHFERIYELIDYDKVVFGGHGCAMSCKLEPTVMDNVSFDDAIMSEEIFGPVLPILTYESIDRAIQTVNSLPHPLAFYIFSSDKENIKKITSLCQFGGGCINDTVIHLCGSNMGFGGVGNSGMGSYHGLEGFRTFSHYKSIVDKKTWLDLPMRYQPYKSYYANLIRMFLK